MSDTKKAPVCAEEIQDILEGYLQVQSFTNSPAEKEAESFFVDFFAALPYFQAHPEHFGLFPIPQDPYQRNVSFAWVQGKGPKTVVLIHHYDVVEIEDFKRLKPLAFSPQLLEEALFTMQAALSHEAREDLVSRAYMYGRGVCDMKGGGAIQMALLRHYSGLSDFTGNVILLGLPDEENLSAGMRAAVLLLQQLQQTHQLSYQIMINSEPHQRRQADTGLFSQGSVGKIMPFVYIRGSLAHVGKIFEGFNPLGLLSEIVRQTEMNTDLSDRRGKEAAPPPTWLYLRDGKQQYDVSIPLSAFGCFSLLSLEQMPYHSLSTLRRICEDSFAQVIRRMNHHYQTFTQLRQEPPGQLPWTAQVMDFGSLCREAEQNHGEEFLQAKQAYIHQLQQRVQKGDVSLIASHNELVEFVYTYIDDLRPRVVYGLIPPYYPNVTNDMLRDKQLNTDALLAHLIRYAQRSFGQKYQVEDYFTGISDLSYSSIQNGPQIIQSLRDSMPFFETSYDLPIQTMEAISMPCLNIGPWGKDFHKLTERVLKEDLFIQTPALLHQAVQYALGHD